ncbi:MAG: GNAT family N-acetyltransferase [Candidatus Eremiobacteraeota bacterium]|nr:GNAT family N-acetyltransferase [Candidatus Eremiobacteraeota bacterium]MBV9647988.1 GNAT family N-acetyltransferase [Candidatus Eremiobacteraeota bacterium]
MTIRRAGASDRIDVESIVNEYNAAIGVIVRDDPEALRRYWEGPGAFWVALDGLEPIGCVALRPLTAVAGNACEVKRLYVRPSHRGRNVADALMDTLEDYARRIGYDAIYLDTYDDLAAAIRLYERRGYERIERYNENPQATVFMRLQL